MDTGIGDKENTGRHLQPATKVCARGQILDCFYAFYT